MILALLGCGSFGVTLWIERASPPRPSAVTAGNPFVVPSLPVARPVTLALAPAQPTAPVAAPAEPASAAPAPAPIDPPEVLDGDELQRVLADVSSADSAARGNALNELRHAEVEVAAPVFGRVLAQDPEPAVRHEALELLAQLRDDPRWHDAADNTLRSRLDDGNEELAARIQERLDRETVGVY